MSTRNKLYLSPLVCINLKHLSFIVGNTDIDFLSSHLPSSPPIASVLNAGLVSAGIEMTVACKIPLNLFVIKLILTIVNSNLTADQIEGSVPGAVDVFQHSSSISTGSSLL